MVCGPEETIERFMDDLRELPQRGMHPYVQRRERHSIIVAELMFATRLGDANILFGDRMTTIMRGSRYSDDELGRYIGSLLALEKDKPLRHHRLPGLLGARYRSIEEDGRAGEAEG